MYATPQQRKVILKKYTLDEVRVYLPIQNHILSNKMKNYWNDQGSTILAFSISLLFCIAFQLTSFILLSKQITASLEGKTKLHYFRYIKVILLSHFLNFLDCLTQFKSVSNNHNERIALIELQNKNQDDGIQILKTEISEHRNQIGQLNNIGKMVKHELFSSSSSEEENGAAITDKGKRNNEQPDFYHYLSSCNEIEYH